MCRIALFSLALFATACMVEPAEDILVDDNPLTDDTDVVVEDPTDDPTEDPTEDPTTVAWEDMDDAARRAYMGEVVMPAMKASFQAFDADRFADFSCATCHGEDGGSIGFEMPNGLFPLSYGGFPYSASDDADTAAWGVFMETDVLPEMAELLGLPEYDRETGEGFGCFGCHAAPVDN